MADHIGTPILLAASAAASSAAGATAAAPPDDFWSVSGWIILGVLFGTLARVRLWFAGRDAEIPGLFLWDKCLRDTGMVGLLFMGGHIAAQATGWSSLYIGGLVGAFAFIGANAVRRILVDALTTAAQNIVNRKTGPRDPGGEA